MAATDYTMWPHYRAKYYDLVDALEECFPDVLEEHDHLRQEVVRIEAYEALIDKIMVDAELWPIYRDKYGYADALTSFYQAQLAASESLKISLIEAARARAAIDKWMTERADLQQDD